MTGEPVDSLHTDVAAYALGLLEAADAQAFEEHLRGCPDCAAELAEFSGMKDLLTGIGPVEPPAGEPALGEQAVGEPAPAGVTDLVRRRALSQRRYARRQILVSVAASVILLAGGLGVGIAVAGRPAAPGSTTPAGAVTVSAVDSATGVHGKAVLVPKPFGAQVTVQLTDITGPLQCQFLAVPRTGKPFLIGTWFLRPGPAFGTHGHPPMQLVGWATIPLRDIARIDVVAKGKGTQISIPV